MRKITFLMFALALLSCKKVEYDPDDFVPLYGTGTDHAADYIKLISEQKIYFGHQSVGRNILSGLEAWQNETGTSFEILESREFSTVPGPALVHFAVGQNGDPRGKVDDFVSMMEQVSEEEQSQAIFKFCYADFTSDTDTESIYAQLKNSMLELKDRYPNRSFIVCTVPYTGIQTGPKALAKKILGRVLNGAVENMKRKEFNEMILNDLATYLPVFDLAAAESTLPDGSVETYRFKGEEYPCLPPIYRSDFGHLNDRGARIVSYNLLAFLAEEMK